MKHGPYDTTLPVANFRDMIAILWLRGKMSLFLHNHSTAAISQKHATDKIVSYRRYTLKYLEVKYSDVQQSFSTHTREGGEERKQILKDVKW